MPNLSALRGEPLAGSRPIIAMRIRNYAAVCASFTDSVEDELVTAISRRLTLPGESPTFYQAEDVLYWLGPALERNDLEGHLKGLARLIDGQFVIRERKLDVHVAFGVDNEQSRSVASRIGRALLAADTGAAKHQLVTFSAIDDDEEQAWELSLMSELDAAIDAGDIWVAYQPQFEITSNKMFGVEALVRWQHPTRGAISPEAFIVPAEVHNRMLRLTLEIVDQATTACRQFVEANPAFRLSVNLSASLLDHPDMADKVSDILWRNGFPPENLTLEVTESAPFSEDATVSANISAFAALGIELSIDDYGTGNATLEYLRSVPCQEIKIDRRFVSGITGNTSDRLLVISTIELAHGLGRRVIAEGIEDAETLAQLSKAGCDIAQGYFLSKPLRLAELKALIAGKRRASLAA
jgi:EAL domain-containing protein (putative c-di-GMP-specific phosphodiesterase class I)